MSLILVAISYLIPHWLEFLNSSCSKVSQYYKFNIRLELICCSCLISQEASETKHKNVKRSSKSEKEILEFTLKYQQVLAERDAGELKVLFEREQYSF